MSIQIGVELSARTKDGNGWNYASINFPATNRLIQDAFQKLRVSPTGEYDIEIVEFPIFGEFYNMNFVFDSIYELNYLAQRLNSLNEDEIDVFNAVTEELSNSDFVKIQDLINSTYGLENVSIISSVSTLEQLGEFAIENDLVNDFSKLPKDILKFFDKKAVGKQQMIADDGVFSGNKYIVAGEYERKNLFDKKAVTLDTASEKWVFRLLVGKAPINSPGETSGSAEWIELPTDKIYADRFAKIKGANCIEECVYFAFESNIPQISDEQFGNMRDWDKLNYLAYQINKMTLPELAKFKAVLEAEKTFEISEIADIADNLHRYELCTEAADEQGFYREYLLHHLDTRFDVKWLKNLYPQTDGEKLLERLGATVTNYGIVSARDMPLFSLVSYDEENTEKSELQSISSEDDTEDILGQNMIMQ